MKYAKEVVQQLQELGLTLAIAEGCTGGMMTNYLVQIPGISKVFLESCIPYSDESKMHYLDVKKETIQTYGSVSHEVAKEMVLGLKTHSKADICISILGIAGPDTIDEKKTAGCVYMACAYQNHIKQLRFQYPGCRFQVQFQATEDAFKLLLYAIQHLD